VNNAKWLAVDFVYPGEIKEIVADLP